MKSKARSTIAFLTAWFFLLATLANFEVNGPTYGTVFGLLSGLGFFIGTVLDLEIKNGT